MSLSTPEERLVEQMSSKILRHRPRNIELENYFNGQNRLKDLRISIPPQLVNVETVAGWAGTTVQVLEERLDLEGFLGPEELGLDQIYRENDLDTEASMAHLDALVYGIGFIIVGKGDEGEADPLVTVESPKRMTAYYDTRLRRVTAAYADRGDEGATLYLPDVTIQLAVDGNRIFEIERDEHNLGRVPVARLVNRPHSGDPDGKSEITRAVRYYTDSAMRTMLGAEVAREFYSAPQRYALGVSEETFQDADGNPLNPWSVIQGRVLALPYNQDEEVMPQVGQFSANSTQPYFEQIKSLATMLAAETAIPASYLGFQTDNPASADAIRQMEARLVKRAERRQRVFGRAWTEVARLALLIRDGEIPEDAREIRPVWRDASTPTRAAAADEAVKLISSGVFLPDSRITYNRIGLTDADIEVLDREKEEQSAVSLVGQLARAAQQAEQDQTVADLVEGEPVEDVTQS